MGQLARFSSMVCLLAAAACGPGLIESGGGTAAPTGAAGDHAVATTMTATTTGGAVTPPVHCTDDTWSSYGETLFAANCVACHAFASSLAGVQSQATQVLSMVTSNQMPPDIGLPASDATRVIAWIKCGLPN